MTNNKELFDVLKRYMTSREQLAKTSAMVVSMIDKGSLIMLEELKRILESDFERVQESAEEFKDIYIGALGRAIDKRREGAKNHA